MSGRIALLARRPACNRLAAGVLCLAAASVAWPLPSGGAPLAERCALTDTDGNGQVDHLDANLNELKSKGGGGSAQNANLDFVELKVLRGDTDIAGWQLCFSSDPRRETCANLGVGRGDWYSATQNTGLPDDRGPDTTRPTVYPGETWIVLDSNNLKADEGEVILFNDRREVVDYIRYSHTAGACSGSAKRWDVDESVCGGCFDSRDPSQKDFARTGPDGTGGWANNGDLASEGANNDGSGASTPAGFAIGVGAGNASTCAPLAVTITALDAGGNPLPGYAGTVDLATTTGHGDWSVATASRPVVPTPDVDDDGAASYTFDAGGDAGTVVLALANNHAESLQVTVTDRASGVTSTSGPVAFGDNAFVIDNTEFAHPLAGRDHRLRVSLYRRDSSLSPPQCAIALNYAGVRTLKGWYAATAAHPPAAAAPSIVDPVSAGSYPLPPAPPAPSEPFNLSLNFVDGSAIFDLRTTDVGQYSLGLTDDSGSFASVPISGSSAMLTTRPLGIRIEVAANPAATTPGGAVFAAAGEAFAVRFSAVRWQGDSIDASGNPVDPAAANDNSLTTAAFAAGVTVGAVLNTPAIGGIAGSVDRGSGGSVIGAAEFAGGVASALDLRYSEVGSMRLTASAPQYLGAPVDVTGLGPVVGRFRPHHFDLSLSNAPSWQAACTAFTYLDQPFGYATAPVVALTAHNAQHGVTSNFFDFGGSDDWWSIEDAHLALGYADPGTPLGVTVAYSGAGTAHDPVDSPTSPGQVVFALRDGLVYRRPVPGSHLPGGGYPDFDAAPVVSVSVANADGADDGDLLITPTETVGATRVRHGRLKMLNANGSELLDLALPLELEYFDGVTWTGAVDDLCTVLAIGDFGYLPDDPADVVTGLAAASGSLDYNCSAVAPCALGAIDITADLADAASTGTAAQPWLRYDWDGDGSDEEPRARASFGTYQGSQRHIYVREVF